MFRVLVRGLVLVWVQVFIQSLVQSLGVGLNVVFVLVILHMLYICVTFCVSPHTLIYGAFYVLTHTHPAIWRKFITITTHTYEGTHCVDTVPIATYSSLCGTLISI